MKKYFPALAVILAAILWSFDGFLRQNLFALPSFLIVSLEHVIGAILLMPFLIKGWQEISALNQRGWISVLWISVCGGILGTFFYTKALSYVNYIDLSVVVLLQKFQPVVAILLAHKVLGEELKREFLLFAILCLVGAFMMSYQEVISSGTYLGQLWQSGHGEELTAKHFYGLVLTFVAVVGWGASTVFGKRLWSMDFLEGQIMFGRFFLGLCFLLPFYVLRDNSPFISMLSIDSSTYLKIFFMVMVSGLAGMGLYYLGLKKTSARQAALAEMFFPFFALGLNWFFLNATLNPIQMVGGALLLLGSTVIQLKHY